MRQAVSGLEDMFAALAEQQDPQGQPRLIEALEAIYGLAEPAPIPPLPDPGAGLAGEWPPADAVTEAPQAAASMPPVVETAPFRLEMPQLQDELDEQLLPIFLEEAQELIQGFSQQLGHWRQDPAAAAPQRALARLLHTFKGSARMAGAMNLGELTHNLETRVEDVLRAGQASPVHVEEIEAGCDILQQFVDRLQGGEGAVAPIAEGEAAPVAVAVEQVPAAPVLRPSPVPAPAEAEGEAGAQKATLRVRADLVDRLVNEAGELSIARARIEGEMRSLKSSLLDLTENVIRLRRQLREIEIQAETQIQAHVAHHPGGQADFDPLELDRFTRFQELTRFMAESVNDVATVQQNLLKNLDDANAAILAQARLNSSLQQE